MISDNIIIGRGFYYSLSMQMVFTKTKVLSNTIVICSFIQIISYVVSYVDVE